MPIDDLPVPIALSKAAMFIPTNRRCGNADSLGTGGSGRVETRWRVDEEPATSESEAESGFEWATGTCLGWVLGDDVPLV